MENTDVTLKSFHSLLKERRERAAPHHLALPDAPGKGDGTLLDHSMILFGSELGQGGSHIVHILPLILAGGAGGALKTGRHIKTPSHTPMANLLVEVLNRMQLGEEVKSFGNSNGGIPGLA